MKNNQKNVIPCGMVIALFILAFVYLSVNPSSKLVGDFGLVLIGLGLVAACGVLVHRRNNTRR